MNIVLIIGIGCSLLNAIIGALNHNFHGMMGWLVAALFALSCLF
jgi:hypothetical protein